MPRKTSKSKVFLLGKTREFDYELCIDTKHARDTWDKNNIGLHSSIERQQFCTKVFENLSGIKLKQGELVKAKLVIVEEEK